MICLLFFMIRPADLPLCDCLKKNHYFYKVGLQNFRFQTKLPVLVVENRELACNYYYRYGTK